MFAVIGDPIEHSISPLLHAAVFSRVGAAAAYERVHVRPDGLNAFVQGLRTGPYCGVNVTIPHKAAIVPLLDGLRGDALFAGAVNTVVRESAGGAVNTVVREGAGAGGAVREGARLFGYNTDMEGLSRAVRGCGYDYAGSVVCVYGTGGAALGAAAKAASCGAKEVRIVGRGAEKTGRVAERARAAGAAKITVFGTKQASDAVSGADIMIHATPLGMKGYGADFEGLAFLAALPPHALVYDCVYTPAETALARAARARGLSAETGLSMLVWQGLISDTLFLRAAGFEYGDAEILTEQIFKSVYNILEKELNAKG